MKTNLPDASTFAVSILESVKGYISGSLSSEELSEDIQNTLERHGELCAKYGAKSIRYQAIDMVLDKFSGAHSTLYKLIADELVSEIQNLEP